MPLIHIQNLSKECYAEMLTELISPYGIIDSFELSNENHSGEVEAFLSMPNEYDARQAVREISGRDVCGMEIRMKIVQEKIAALPVVVSETE